MGPRQQFKGVSAGGAGEPREPDGDVFCRAHELRIDNWRAGKSGVPFICGAGNGCPKQGSGNLHSFFGSGARSAVCGVGKNLRHNVLVLRVQPKEGISLLINAKTPGTVSRIAPAHMDFNL